MDFLKTIVIFLLVVHLKLFSQGDVDTLNKKKESYKVDFFSFRYSIDSVSLPSLTFLDDLKVSLKYENGIYFPGEDSYSIYQDFKGDYFSIAAIKEIAKAILKAMNERGLIGVIVRVDPDQITKNGQDIRENTQNITFIIYPTVVSKIQTTAKGERFDYYELENNNNYDYILENSPIQPYSSFQGYKYDYLKQDLMDNYLAKLNRNKRRYIQAKIEKDPETSGVILNYIVQEDKPWIVYFSAMNTGAKYDRKWNEVFGYINTQLTSRDDSLSLTYLTGSFKKIDVFNLNYETQIRKGFYLKVLALLNNYKASSFGMLNTEFSSREIAGRVEFGNNFYQNKNLFIDVFVDGKFRNINVTNRINKFKEDANFFLPYLGFRLENVFYEHLFKGIIKFGGNCKNIAYTPSEQSLEIFGRENVDNRWTVLKADIYASNYFGSSLDIFKPHEFIFNIDGQYAFNYRLIPQARVVYGGQFTVRGYPESISAGDSGINIISQYQYHVAKGYFNRKNYQLRGLPDWDLIPSVFLDYAGTINNKKPSYELDLSLLGSGVGLEYTWKNNLRMHLQLGFALLDFIDPLEKNNNVYSGHSEVHFSTTLTY